MSHICDCGQRYDTLAGLEAHQINNHGQPRTCAWTEDGDGWGNYETSCKNIFSFIDGGPEENDFKYCPYCGRGIKL